MKKRSTQLEIIDLGSKYYTPEEYWHCLDQLDKIGRYIGATRATIKAFRQFNPKSVIDVGCGGGKFTRRLGRLFPQAKVTGIDVSVEAVSYAKPENNVEFEAGALDVSKKYDIVTSTLVCHHMSDDQLVKFLKEAYKIANQAIVINDLHRHPIAYGCFFLLSRTLFRNRLVKHDGLISIKRGFKRVEWVDYLQKAEIPLEKCSLNWHLPFRWILTIRK